MKLLVITQKIDANDANLGFFVDWLTRLAAQAATLSVICLEKGDIGQLPQNIRIFSLGKELGGRYRLRAFYRFYKIIIENRHDYDGVFIHMNTEYALLGGLFWRVWDKKVLFWYTHKAVTWQLRVAEKLVTKIFTASKESFRLKSKKAEIVGHGTNLGKFAQALNGASLPPMTEELRLLAVGRVAPVKCLEIIIRALAELCKQNTPPKITLSIVGTPILLEDKKYFDELGKLVQDLELSSRVNFKQGVPHGDIWKEYQRHHILIHVSQTGSVDKVVLEALASGRIVITSSEAFGSAVAAGTVYAFPAGNIQKLVQTVEKIYRLSPVLPNNESVEFVRRNHNLDTVINKILDYFRC